MAFPRKNRIKIKAEIDALFKSKKSIRGQFVVVKWLENGLKTNRFLISVSNKASNKSSERNRIKRVLSELLSNIRLNKATFSDYVVLVHQKSDELALKNDLKGVFNRLK